MDLSQYQELLNAIGGNENTVIVDEATTQVTLPNPSNGYETLIFTVINKTIHTPIVLNDILVQGDVNSRKIHFVINRYFDGVDLSNKDIFINYQNALNQTGYSVIENFTYDDKLIEFDWWVDSRVTTLEGNVSIQVEICELDAVGDVVYRYQTVPLDLKIEKTVISNGDAKPVDYYLDIKFLNEHANPVYYEGMVSTTAPIEIANRTIIMPALENIAVTQDSRSRLITFKIQRYIDNVDLSEKTACIKYKLIDGTGDRSFVCNQVITDTHLKFDWLLDSKVTSLVGKVEFAIEFIGYNEKGEFYCFNTLPAYIFVSEGLSVDNVIEQPTASWIQSWNILAEQYLRDYMRYLEEAKMSAEQALESAGTALMAMNSARASEISAQNDAGIAWQQADRAERMANLTGGYYQNVNTIRKQINETYNKFLKEYENLRKKDEPITLADLSETLQEIILTKADEEHEHSAYDIETNNERMFVTKEQLENLQNARLKTTPIKESDLDASIVEKLNNAGTGNGNGTSIIIKGAEIDDTAPSYSKVYSSQTTENKINALIKNAIDNLGGVLSDNNFTDEEKQKLARIEDNANYFTLTTVSASIVEETPIRQFLSPTDREEFLDKYTKSEIDNMFSKVTSGLVWKPEVPKYEDIATYYPDPIKDWAVSTANGDTYLYDGEQWIKIGSGKTPIATKDSSGLMSSSDKSKLDGIESGANKYVHPKTHSATMIEQTDDRQFVTKAQKKKIDEMDKTIETALEDYRKIDDKIKEEDLDQAFLDKVASAGGTIISDGITSSSKTYSSAKIEALLQDIIDDTATTADIDVLFRF